jgi:hypothetical protein
MVNLWDPGSGKLLSSFRHLAWVYSVVFSPDGTRLLSGSEDHTMRLWDIASGRLIRTFEGHSGSIQSVGFSKDGLRVLSASKDTTLKVWNTESGKLLITLLIGRNDQWLAISRDGFFAASGKGADDTLSVVRGFDVTTIGQVWQSLYSPDLVREALAGDANGEVEEAAKVISLEKVLGSGPAPLVAITSHVPGSQPGTDLVTIAARITDRGKGVGRIEWRVNGVTAGVTGVAAGPGPYYEVNQAVALDPGENKVEVIAFNARNLLASLPARTTIPYTGADESVKPKLLVLAIGINNYVDKGWIAPGGSEPAFFPKLSLAVSDAKALAAGLQRAGAGYYSEVQVRTVLDTEATADGLDAIMSKMAAGIHPRDTFVFFAAAHGYSHEGRFYLIPQDYQGGNNPEALATRAIDQTRLQDWIANRIKAKKAVILLDTCESGALTNGYAHSRIDAPASEAGVGRLHEATGRPVLTAAAAGQFAHEGVIAGTGERRGVFTWAGKRCSGTLVGAA